MSLIMKQKSPFAIEVLRATLARKNKLKDLSKTYTKAYPEIPDQNSAKKWDYLNIEGRDLIQRNPMETDRINIIGKLINGTNPSIINIGFGSASLEKKLVSKKKYQKLHWFGIDISHASVKKAQKDLPHGKFSVGDILDIDSKNNTFDYAIAMEVLEHIPPRSIFQALHEVYRILKPGGYFICSVPLNEGLEQMIARGENPNAHVRMYTPQLISAELSLTGFTKVKEKTLFAFHNFYTIKSLIANHLLQQKYKPNNIIILSQKPL